LHSVQLVARALLPIPCVTQLMKFNKNKRWFCFVLFCAFCWILHAQRKPNEGSSRYENEMGKKSRRLCG
jgi:hypothetical protein